MTTNEARCAGCRSCAWGGEVPCPTRSPEKAESIRQTERDTRPAAVHAAMVAKGLA